MEIKGLSNPLLSIVIPTKNRIHYVKSAITSILEISDERIELVIQDNSDSNELLLWINKEIKDARLIYNYSTLPLSFVANFSEGVSLSKGEYVCVIGDDDGINPNIINVAEWMKYSDIDCLSTRISANFVWGDAEVPTTLFTKVTGGVLTVSELNGILIETNPLNELHSYVQGGLINYLDFNLPKIYHGIVKRKCLDQVKNIAGTYFGGLSPDIFAAISIACVANNVFVTDYPFTISGVCGVSASIVEGLLKKNSKKLEDAPHLKNRGHYEWSELVPKVYCVETIWADSAIAALKSMGKIDLLNQINVIKLSASCINSNSGIWNEVVSTLKKVCLLRNQNFILTYILFLFHLFLLKLKKVNLFFNRVTNRILIIMGKQRIHRIDNLLNINEATYALIKYLVEKKFIFTGFVNKGKGKNSLFEL
jgi:glycosyltransferase involved in cell wall biosynthesis